MAATADQVITAYIKLRDKRSEIKKAYEAEDKELTAKMDQLETWLLSKVDEVGTEQRKAGDGAAVISTRDRAT